MVLQYMVLHGSHQYTQNLLAFFYQHQPDPSWVMIPLVGSVGSGSISSDSSHPDFKGPWKGDRLQMSKFKRNNFHQTRPVPRQHQKSIEIFEQAMGQKGRRVPKPDIWCLE